MRTTPGAPASADTQLHEPEPVSWGVDRRLRFIDFRLRWEGRINRTDLTEFFGLSIPQASLDIARYLKLAPGNLTYDPRSKTYLATETFQALYRRSSARRYLAELLSIKMGVVEPTAGFIGTAPSIDWAPNPGRTLDEGTVEAIVRAINRRQTLEVDYQSMSSPEPSTRFISPHALGFDGFRWHVRAYCHSRLRFSDFVMARILRIGAHQPSSIDPSTDFQWDTVLTLKLTPNPKLSAAKRRVIEIDYGMHEGHVDLQCRQAFLYYTLRRLGLHVAGEPDPHAQQIVLKNRAEIQPFIDSLSQERTP